MGNTPAGAQQPQLGRADSLHEIDDSLQGLNQNVGSMVGALKKSITSTAKEEIQCLAIIRKLQPKIKRWICFDALLSFILLIGAMANTSPEVDVGLITFPTILFISLCMFGVYKCKEKRLSRMKMFEFAGKFWSIFYILFVITHSTALGQFILSFIAAQSANNSGKVTVDTLGYLFLSITYGWILLTIGQMLNKLCNAYDNSYLYKVMKKIEST